MLILFILTFAVVAAAAFLALDHAANGDKSNYTELKRAIRARLKD